MPRGFLTLFVSFLHLQHYWENHTCIKIYWIFRISQESH